MTTRTWSLATLDPFPQTCKWGEVPAGFVAPFHLDALCCYVWDAENHVAADFPERGGPVRPRGWGRVQYRPNGGHDMDAWEDWLNETVGDATDPHEVVRRMNLRAAAEAR